MNDPIRWVYCYACGHGTYRHDIVGHPGREHVICRYPTCFCVQKREYFIKVSEPYANQNAQMDLELNRAS